MYRPKVKTGNWNEDQVLEEVCKNELSVTLTYLSLINRNVFVVQTYK